MKTNLRSLFALLVLAAGCSERPVFISGDAGALPDGTPPLGGDAAPMPLPDAG